MDVFAQKLGGTHDNAVGNTHAFRGERRNDDVTPAHQGAHPVPQVR